MKVFTPEISWHQKEPIFSVDFCSGTWKLASAGADFTIKIWQVKEDSEGNVGLDFLANLDRHSKPVNCVRFSPDGKYLASAGDDCIIIIWKLSEGEDDLMAEPSFGSDDIVNKEKWTVHKMLRRGHLEDIYDLAWSPDGTQLVSGSVDNSAIIWDIAKGHFTNIIKDHKHYVQGVCWDPRGQYVITHSSDRTCKVYSLSKNRCVQTIHRASFPLATPTEDGQTSKTTKLFMDETMQSFFRRCRFSPDGLLLVLPGGLYDTGEKPVKATYVFARGGFNKPALCLPASKKASVGVCFCPTMFENMHKDDKEDDDKENQSEGIFKLPYRMCYAVATLDSVLFYDTQHSYPFGFVSNVHYASLTDMTWSSDGRILVVSSLDGYCSIVSFKDGELGKQSQIDPMEFVSNKLKARREAKKEAKKVENECKGSPVTVVEKQKEQTGHTAHHVATPGKDQPTLHQFITPVRKRKRPFPSQRTPTSGSTSKEENRNGNSDGPVGGNESPKDIIMKPLQSPLLSPTQPACNLSSTPLAKDATPVTSVDKKTPKRANLISLGFKPIPKPNSDIAKQGGSGAVAATENTDSKNNQPRRISFTTLSAESKETGPSSSSTLEQIKEQSVVPKATYDSSSSDKGSQLISNPSESQIDPTTIPTGQSKPGRRVALTPVSVKRDHSGAVKKVIDLTSDKVETMSLEPGTVNVSSQSGNTEKAPRRINVMTVSMNNNSTSKETNNGTGSNACPNTTNGQGVKSIECLSSASCQSSTQEISTKDTISCDTPASTKYKIHDASVTSKESDLKLQSQPTPGTVSSSPSRIENLSQSISLPEKNASVTSKKVDMSETEDAPSSAADKRIPCEEVPKMPEVSQTHSHTECKSPRRVEFRTLKKM